MDDAENAQFPVERGESLIFIALYIFGGLLLTALGGWGLMDALARRRRWRAAETTTGWILEKKEHIHEERIPVPGMMTRWNGPYRSVTHVYAHVLYRAEDGRYARIWLDTGPQPGRSYEDGRVPVRYEYSDHGLRVVTNPRDRVIFAVCALSFGLLVIAIGVLAATVS